MNHSISLGLAQFTPIKGDIEENYSKHLDLIVQAAEENIQLLVFPELSLTGYEPELAKELALDYSSNVLHRLQLLAVKYAMTILVGAPLKTETDTPELALIILSPDKPICHYSKIHLHGIEKTYFTAGIQYKILSVNSFRIGLAICADTTHPEHIQKSVDLDADCYLASLLISESGYASDAQMFANYAKQHELPIGIANYCGTSGPYTCAGKSTFWNSSGEIISQATASKSALVTTVITL